VRAGSYHHISMWQSNSKLEDHKKAQSIMETKLYVKRAEKKYISLWPLRCLSRLLCILIVSFMGRSSAWEVRLDVLIFLEGEPSLTIIIKLPSCEFRYMFSFCY
jgi:hypothetical protein